MVWFWIMFVPWVLGLIGLIVRGWYFQIHIWNNLAVGTNFWSWTNRGFFDSSGLNATGAIYHRKLIKLWFFIVAYVAVGIMLIGIFQWLVAGTR